MTKVMRSKPAKHGKRSEGKHVVVSNIDGWPLCSGTYHYVDKYSCVVNAPCGPLEYKAHRITLEEIIETEE